MGKRVRLEVAVLEDPHALLREAEQQREVDAHVQGRRQLGVRVERLAEAAQQRRLVARAALGVEDAPV
eukprot:CAMPEP_0119371278 /NCGR_PEP_ID=MMETSP1334-20130426/17485_1 /TAXON_ID=127549 /ORGANISM="Calcidiscus leptoporus, Strain RCC1130" /LENGTH=67 /DNA_ID=CAMNT_0007388521 /DNA_START=385 /DNA_END=589 /DNA_ORIENTATION=+